MTHRSRSGGPQKIRRQKNGNSSGPKKLHHPPPPTSLPPVSSSLIQPLPSTLSPPTHADILALLHAALRSTLDDSAAFTATVQKIKGLLYDRQWLEVFTDRRLLNAYAGRWVPSRAMCFRDLLGGLKDVRAVLGLEEGGEGKEKEEEKGDEDHDEDDDEEGEDENAGAEEVKVESEGATEGQPDVPRRHILSIGGGAGSELLALSALLHGARNHRHTPLSWHWTGVDIGDWDSVLSTLSETTKTQWNLTDETLSTTYLRGDVLATVGAASTDNEENTATSPTSHAGAHAGLATYLSPNSSSPVAPPDLTTILFTLTELLTQSRPTTLAFLAFLTSSTKPGSLLLVADSASDISEFTLGSSGRAWPVWMVLDAILVGVTGEGGKGWEKVGETDSKWWRVPEGVGAGYPCKLENVRYWMRLYRRV